MNGIAMAAQQKVIKFVQELLLDEDDKSGITAAAIAEKIDLVLRMNPRWGEGLNREYVTDELIRRFSLWVGQDTMLKSDAGHEAWLAASRKRDWRYWQRYREWLERRLSFKAVEGLEQSTDTVLGLLEDPLRAGMWARRGLVVGHVQSGKTGHYTGLICKAADAGYKIVIVLAGLHNNLRSQTQMRLDEGFLGYETKPVQEDIQIIGVGEIDGDPSIRPNFATNRANKGDFTTSGAKNVGISPEQRPWLFVVKKNKSVLERLLRWIRNHVADLHDQDSGRRIVAVIGGGEGARLALRDDVVIDMMKRKMKGTHDDRYSIGRLMSPRDEAIDLDEDAWKAALQVTRAAWHADPGRREDVEEPDTPNGPAVRRVRGFGAPGVKAHAERGLFCVYGLDPQEAEAGFPDDTPPIAAFAISFPGSNSGTKVEYKVNNVLWEQEYGSAE